MKVGDKFYTIGGDMMLHWAEIISVEDEEKGPVMVRNDEGSEYTDSRPDLWMKDSPYEAWGEDQTRCLQEIIDLEVKLTEAHKELDIIQVARKETENE